ncbi:MAG: hypothetical protein DRN25_02265 [Thermoplasmata archaeon]|nr:MAG: hypothetical protein DRN25_02265 [Thermoplasmata archaeon]
METEFINRIKKKVDGVIGVLIVSFPVGEVVFSNLPDLYDKKLEYLSQSVSMLSNEIHYGRIIIEGEEGRILIRKIKDKDVAIILFTDKSANTAMIKILMEKIGEKVEIEHMGEIKKKIITFDELMNSIIEEIKKKLSSFGGEETSERILSRHTKGKIESIEELEDMIHSICSTEIAEIFGSKYAKKFEERLIKMVREEVK